MEKFSAAADADWAKQDDRRMLHVTFCVCDLDNTITYYEKHFGLKEARIRDFPGEEYSHALLAAGPEDKNFALELIYDYGVDNWEIGSGFGHFALRVENVYQTVDSIQAAGGEVSRAAGPVKGGDRIIAFVNDPTGYKWEIIGSQGKPIPEPIAQVMLRVRDLDRSIKFYTEALGMQLLRKEDNPEYKYTLAFLAYGPEEENVVFELTYNWGQDEYEFFLGGTYEHVVISTNDVFMTAEEIRSLGYEVTKEPGRNDWGGGPKTTETVDPDGWKVVFMDKQDFLAELQEP